MGQYLKPRDRAAFYRELAAAALRRGKVANEPDQKAMHIDEAARWLALAVEVEHVSDRLRTYRADKPASDGRPKPS